MEVVEIEWLAEKCVNQETAAYMQECSWIFPPTVLWTQQCHPHTTVLGSHSGMIWCITVSKFVYQMIQQPLKVWPCSLSGGQPVELLYPQPEKYWTQPCTQKQQPRAKIQTWVTTVQWKCHQRIAKGWGSGVLLLKLYRQPFPLVTLNWHWKAKTLPQYYLHSNLTDCYKSKCNWPWDSLV